LLLLLLLKGPGLLEGAGRRVAAPGAEVKSEVASGVRPRRMPACEEAWPQTDCWGRVGRKVKLLSEPEAVEDGGSGGKFI